MDLKEVHKYIGRVADGKENTSEYFKLACQRHFNDLLIAKDKNWVYDDQEAEKNIKFLTKVARHTKDRWAGKLFGAQPFQCAMWAMFYGWQMHSEDVGDYIRRFYTLYFDIARKNGKTELVATVANNAFTRSSHGAEVYCAATKREQAFITFKTASAQMRFMQRHSSSLRRRVKVRKFNMEIPAEDGVFQPVSSDHNTLDGMNPLVAIVDEYHAHRTSDVLDVMETGQGSRWDGAILAVTTTAGFNKEYPCYEFRKNSIEVLKGTRTDDRLLPFIFAMDESDDWQNPENWYKPNPNLGVSVSLEWLKGQYQKAVNEGPTKQRQFKTKNLNMWVDADQVWIEKSVWLANSEKSGIENYKHLYGKKCYGALDLSSVRDLTSIALAFPKQQGLDRPHIIAFHFCPEKRAKEMQRKGYHHMNWAKEKWMHITTGNVIDDEQVRLTIMDCKKKFKLKKIAFDRWGAKNVVTPLLKTGLEFIPHGQGFGDMNDPSKQFESDVYSDKVKIEHFGNPVLAWEIGNAVVRMDPAGNIKPDKQNANGQIDGIVASVMAYGLMKVESVKSTAYKNRGIRTL